MKLIAAITCLTVLCGSAAIAQDTATDTRPGIAPDIREDETRLKVQRGDFVVVPIPFSNPRLESGLVAGAAYFYSRSEEQKKQQPASVTGAAPMYTSNDSRAFAVVQQNYWRDDRWHFTGAVGATDLRLSLLTFDQSTVEQGCQRGGTAPLWDACTIKLRGFAGSGYVGNSFSGIRDA